MTTSFNPYFLKASMIQMRGPPSVGLKDAYYILLLFKLASRSSQLERLNLPLVAELHQTLGYLLRQTAVALGALGLSPPLR